jgi:hypothetical protein
MAVVSLRHSAQNNIMRCDHFEATSREVSVLTRVGKKRRLSADLQADYCRDEADGREKSLDS